MNGYDIITLILEREMDLLKCWIHLFDASCHGEGKLIKGMLGWQKASIYID